ncbi:MAG: division/cell wall cluster transcriptional repressor MraZ [Nitrososphaerales archaeon]
MTSIKRVDKQGRIALPSKWRSKALKGSKEVTVSEHGDVLEIRPRKKVDLTMYFDSVVVDVDPNVFLDYKLLKKSLLKDQSGKTG